MGMFDDAMREMRRMERSMNHMMAPYWMQPSTRAADTNAIAGFSEVIIPGLLHLGGVYASVPRLRTQTESFRIIYFHTVAFLS